MSLFQYITEIKANEYIMKKTKFLHTSHSIQRRIKAHFIQAHIYKYSPNGNNKRYMQLKREERHNKGKEGKRRVYYKLPHEKLEV